jgi:Ca2+-binding RTX toxin-like protein
MTIDYTTTRYGTSGNDVFDNRVNSVFNTVGGAGDDSFITDEFANFQAGQGNDTIVGGASGATAIYWDAPASIYVDLQAGYANDGWSTRDTLTRVSAIQATPFNDTLLGDGLNNQFWPNGGNDLIDGRGGVDELIISARPADVRWSRAGSDWRYEYNDASGKLVSSSTVRNVELVKYYSDGAFSVAYRLLSAGSAPTPISFDAVAPKLDVELVAPSLWTISQFGIGVVPITEAYPTFYYPTSADYHPPGIFLPNPHNAAVGDFNGDGRADIWVSWVAFPHTVDRQTQLAPTVFMGTSTGLSALPASSVPVSLNRHMAYRTMAADFNGDGIDDVAFGGMGVITRLAGGGFANEWERHGLAIFGGNTVTDGTGLLEGQGANADLSNWGFAHDGSAGDVSGDGRADLYAGGRLWVSNSADSWNLATDYLPSAIPRSPPMSSAIGDLDGDSRQDLVMLWPSFGSSAFAVMSSGASYPAFTSVALPPPLYGSNSKANNCAIADLNGDGLGDIVVATTRSEPYYQGAALQLLIQTSPGVFEDQTTQRIDNSASDLSQGEGQLRIFDANGDGLIDIVHSLDSRGANIFLNDGSGHFTLFDLTSFPFVQSSQVQGLQSAPAGGQNQPSKLFPVDFNKDGLSDFLSYLVLGDYATHAGNIATLYTVIGSEQAWGRDKSEMLAGTSLGDYIRGYGGNDALTGRGGDDTLDGGAGIDTAVFTGTRANYAQTKLADGWMVRSSAEGIDTLKDIERLRFLDKNIALDLGVTQSGGEALLVLGALAPAAIKAPSTVGLFINYFDAGHSPRELFQLALDVGLVNAIAGSNSNEALVSMIYRNFTGAEADKGTVDILASYLDGRNASYSQVDFLTGVAGFPINQEHVGLVGLQQAGIEYALG